MQRVLVSMGPKIWRSGIPTANSAHYTNYNLELSRSRCHCILCDGHTSTIFIYSFKNMPFLYSSVNLSPYYLPTREIEDYICAKPSESGMRQCSNLPLYQYEGIKCNGSAKPFVNNTPTNNSCVNWNQYYTVCDTSDKNPFQGAISFDNIGLAWVAIFQVCIRVRTTAAY